MGLLASFSELRAVIPPLTLVHLGLAGAGVRGIARNLAAAAMIALAAAFLIHLVGTPPQWIALGVGLYAAVSWLQALALRDRPTHQLITQTPTLRWAGRIRAAGVRRPASLLAPPTSCDGSARRRRDSLGLTSRWGLDRHARSASWPIAGGWRARETPAGRATCPPWHPHRHLDARDRQLPWPRLSFPSPCARACGSGQRRRSGPGTAADARLGVRRLPARGHVHRPLGPHRRALSVGLGGSRTALLCA